MTSPILFKDILPGDVIRAEWTYNLSGTKVTMEGEVASIYPKENLLHIMTYVKGGIGGWEISEHSNVYSSKATFYLINRRNNDEGILLTKEDLRKLPFDSCLEIIYNLANAPICGTLISRTEYNNSCPLYTLSNDQGTYSLLEDRITSITLFPKELHLPHE